ncbi:MAG TPA: pyruvate dehydrogenase (acetyl-transferring) E1 component subunit alpha [Clostridia bacterium]|nr:pyruvate dehydrogenase (acetyl-transferring) E1 component subunit alpha [Clostridia bacterium]
MSRTFEITKYNEDFLIDLLENMILIRRFEEKAGQMYGLQKIGGFCHLYIGQEAVAVGSIAALDLAKDYVLTTYRDHGHALACGMEPGVLMAELYGKKTGCSKGKGGSMHLFDVENHMYGGHGIVGSHIPLATGVALKIKYKEDDGVVACYFGDGAIHQGSFHESLNMARIWDLPIVFICENNQYGMGTNYERISSVHDFYKMGDSYGIPGKQVDGMNVLEVYEEMLQAAKTARESGLPSFLEIKTYRYRGHSMSDPAKYRTREELDEYRRQDPVLLFKDALIEYNVITEEDYREMDNRYKEVANRATEFAENSEEPGLETLYEDILA